jgi:hypothetical protein
VHNSFKIGIEKITYTRLFLETAKDGPGELGKRSRQTATPICSLPDRTECGISLVLD